MTLTQELTREERKELCHKLRGVKLLTEEINEEISLHKPVTKRTLSYIDAMNTLASAYRAFSNSTETELGPDTDKGE